MTTYISLGNDCTIAHYLRDRNYRTDAYPFDWNVTYSGIYNIFNTNFEKFFCIL